MMTSRLLTTANQITLLRLIFVPFFAILVMERSYRGALAIHHVTINIARQIGAVKHEWIS